MPTGLSGATVVREAAIRSLIITILVTNSYIRGNWIEVRIIAKRTLRDFWTKHADCEQQLKAWFRETEQAEWRGTHELKKDHPSASVLQENRIVFNIKGNKYRLIVRFNFDYQLGWIRFVGTHAEYDRIDANTI